MELAAAFTAFNAAYDGLKNLKSISDEITRQQAVAEVHRQVMAAQQVTLEAQRAQAELQVRVGDLVRELEALKAWGEDKERYELAPHPNGRSVLVYALKQGRENGEPLHYLCPTCFQGGRKSILHRRVYSAEGRAETLHCHPCGGEILLSGLLPRSPVARGR